MAAKIGGIIIDVAADTASLVKGMTKAQQAVDKNVKMMKSALGPLAAAFAGVVSISALKNIVDTADNLGKQAQVLALSTEAWSRYTYAAKFAGVEVGTLSGAMSAMIRRTNNFSRDGGGAASKALNDLGINAEFARKNFTSTEKTFDIIIDKLGRMENSNRKTAIAQDIFSKSAAKVMLYANMGSKEIARLGEVAKQTGNIISSEFAQDAAELNDGLETLGTMVTGIGNKLMTNLTPALVTASKALEQFLGIQRESTAYELKKEITEITEKLELYEKIVNSRSPENRSKTTNNATILFVKKARLEKELKDLLEMKKKVKDIKTDFLTPPAFTAPLDKTSKPSKSSKTTKVNTEQYDEQVKSYYEYMDEKLKIEEEFADVYNATTMERFEYDRLKLDEQKAEYLQYGQERAKVEKWFAEKSKEITDEELKEFKKAQLEKREAAGTWVEGMDDALTAYNEKVNSTYAISKNFFETSLDGMSSSLADFIIEGKASFSDFAESIIKDLAKIIIQKQIAGIAGNILGAFSFGAADATAMSSVPDTMSIIPHATGGVVDSPSYFPMSGGKTGLMGEAGAEAILPLSRIGSDLGVKSMPSKVTFNIENNTGTAMEAEMFNEMTKTNESGEEDKIITVVINGVSRNKNGIRDMLKGIR